MKGNIKKILVIIGIIICIIGVIIYVFKNNKTEESQLEYEPQEEISQEQERQTMISLYFVNKTTREIEPEARLIDVKELVVDPYTTLINLLIEGPKNENHEKAIPEGTKLLGAEIEGEVLRLNFSTEFTNNHIGGEIEEKNTINSIVNTLTELTEVNEIKILINGEENKSFNDKKIDFNHNFIRND